MLLEVAVGKGDILILAAISLCPIKHGKAFLVISVWLYFSRQIPSHPCNSCSQWTALGRVVLRKEQTQFFRDEGQHPYQTRILHLTENYLKNFYTRHRISQWNSPSSHITHKSETGGGSVWQEHRKSATLRIITKILEYMQEINPVLDIFQLLTSTSKEQIQNSIKIYAPNLEATLVLMCCDTEYGAQTAVLHTHRGNPPAVTWNMA